MRFPSEFPEIPAVSSVAAALLLALGFGTISGAAWAGPAIEPHSAVYSMVLDRSKTNRGLADARGRIDFKWIEGCDGWTVEQRTLLVMTDSAGTEFSDAWTLKAWESKDGRSYRFSVDNVPGQGEPETSRGKAQLSTADGSGEVRFADPETPPLTLPAGTMFPTAYSLTLMEAAERGEFIVWRHVFDGSGDGDLFGVNAVVLGALPPGAPSDFQSPLTGGHKSWRVRFAYFDASSQDGEPDHEMGQRVYANGVVDELEFEYEDFSLRATLERLEPLPRPDCKP